MPVLDGYGSLQLIKTHIDDERRPIVIALTASAMRGDRENAIAKGFDNYISKPIRISELSDALRWASDQLKQRRTRE